MKRSWRILVLTALRALYCIALRCVALHLQMQLGMDSDMFLLLIFVWDTVLFSGYGYDGRAVCGNVGYAFAMCVGYLNRMNFLSKDSDIKACE